MTTPDLVEQLRARGRSLAISSLMGNHPSNNIASANHFLMVASELESLYLRQQPV